LQDSFIVLLFKRLRNQWFFRDCRHCLWGATTRRRRRRRKRGGGHGGGTEAFLNRAQDELVVIHVIAVVIIHQARARQHAASCFFLGPIRVLVSPISRTAVDVVVGIVFGLVVVFVAIAMASVSEGLEILTAVLEQSVVFVLVVFDFAEAHDRSTTMAMAMAMAMGEVCRSAATEIHRHTDTKTLKNTRQILYIQIPL
jgi:hypothetical protein